MSLFVGKLLSSGCFKSLDGCSPFNHSSTVQFHFCSLSISQTNPNFGYNYSLTMVYGSLWIFTDVYGSLWIFMDVYGCLWIFMDLYGSLWMFMDLYGSLWMFMDVYGSLWIFMDVYGCLWMFMDMVYLWFVGFIKTNTHRGIPTQPPGVLQGASRLLFLWPLNGAQQKMAEILQGVGQINWNIGNNYTS